MVEMIDITKATSYTRFCKSCGETMPYPADGPICSRCEGKRMGEELVKDFKKGLNKNFAKAIDTALDEEVEIEGVLTDGPILDDTLLEVGEPDLKVEHENTRIKELEDKIGVLEDAIERLRITDKWLLKAIKGHDHYEADISHTIDAEDGNPEREY